MPETKKRFFFMRVPVPLINAFKDGFEPVLTDFLLQNELLPEPDALKQKRFLTRSVAPHVKTLSELFNRKEGVQTDAIDTETYWTEGSNPKNRRLAYFLSFMPPNLFRVSSVWAELHRLGFKWPFSAETEFRGLEWGAGTASGACGILAGEKYAPIGLPERGSFALIEQSKAALTMGTKWFDHYAQSLGSSITARPFHRRVDLSEAWLPKAAPKFHLFVMSYFLNESDLQPETLVKNFVDACDKHLEDEGIAIIVEPALKLQSRKLLNFRKALLENPRLVLGDVSLKVLTPCLGHQACGALAREDDWCHEEASWWRPGYLRELDSLVGLDRKTLPYSYLVIQKTKKPLEEILPTLKGAREKTYRLVSPSHSLSKKTSEFFVCGQDGKRRARYAPGKKEEMPNRGDILMNTDLHGDPALSQIDRAEILLQPELPEASSSTEEQNDE
jgi:hypothetical protein